MAKDHITITMHRLLTVIKLNSRNYSFASNISKTVTATKKINEFPTAEIEDAMKRIPDLQKYSEDQWKNTFDTFINQGFQSYHFMKIIGKRPQLLSRSTEKLAQSLECLREAQFGDLNLFELIQQHPEVLEYTDSLHLRKRLAFLKSYAKTERNIFRLFMSSPNVITDKQTVLDEKINYLIKVMKVDESEAAKSKVFSHSLDVIKCRHVFLSRLGLFKPRNPKADPMQPSKNPKMCYIYDTSDKEFAVKTCGITLDEYETFIQLYEREKHRDEEEYEN